MSARRMLPWLLGVGMVAVGCGDTPADQSGQPPTAVASSTSVVSTRELDVIVAPDEDGDYPPDLVVACPGGPPFPISSLDTIAPISPDDPDGLLAAADTFLDSEEGAYWAQEGWQLLHQTQSEAILVAPFEGSLEFMLLTNEGDEWVWSGSSGSPSPCDLQYTIPAGLNSVEWRLDPAAPEPAPEDTDMQVLLQEVECVSGQEIGDRLLGPQVVLTDTEVRIAFAAEPPPGDAFTCPGNPETPHTVELPEPLGHRQIVESMSIGISLEDHIRQPGG